MPDVAKVTKANLFGALLAECERRASNAVESERDFWETRSAALKASQTVNNKQSAMMLRLLARHPRNAKLKELCENLK
jgi:hypothetical protein